MDRTFDLEAPGHVARSEASGASVGLQATIALMILAALAATAAVAALSPDVLLKAAEAQMGSAKFQTYVDPAGLAARLGFMRLSVGLAASALLVFWLLHISQPRWRHVQILIFCLPFAAVAFLAAYKAQFGVRDMYYMKVIEEDGPVEYATALLVFAAFLFFARAAVLARDGQTRLFLSVLSFGMLFIALSEISFGQRIFAIETPEAMLNLNRQEEISLHNIHGVEYVVYRVLPLMILGYAILGQLIASILLRSPLKRKLSSNLLKVAPPPFYAAPYLAVIVLGTHEHWLTTQSVINDQEPAELLMAVGFLLVALRAWSCLSRMRAPATTAT